MAGGIIKFFKLLNHMRVKEFSAFKRKLNGKKYKNIISTWSRFLDSDETGGLLSDVPVIELADKVISKRYNSILKSGMKIDDNSPDELLHQLRIEFKKLRYLIEFFKSLFLPELTDRILKRMKHLQDVLGVYNDLSVQQAFLKNTTQAISDDREINLAIGALIGHLNKNQKRIRGDFKSAFKEFSSGSVQKLMKDMINSNPGDN